MIPTREVNYDSPSFILGVEYGVQQLKTSFIEDYKRSKTGLVGAANRLLRKSSFEHELENAIPRRRKDGTKDKRYKKYRAIAKLFDKARLSGTGRVKNYLLLRTLMPKVYDKGRLRKVNSQDYANEKNKRGYNMLKNTRKKLNEWWLHIGYRLEFHSSGYCEVVRLNQEATQS